jgi:hypothetical protein
MKTAKSGWMAGNNWAPVQREIGFENIRMHGIPRDDMGVYRAIAKAIRNSASNMRS